MRILTAFKVISLSLALAALSSCSNSNNSPTALIDASGKHADNWVQQHWVAYKLANGGSSDVTVNTSCSECHGADLSGGISKVSCFQATFNGMYCHANADHTLGHPSSWADPTSPDFHGASSFNGVLVKGYGANLASASSCGLCHATGSGGTAISSAPSCLSTNPQWGISCHVSSPATDTTSNGCVSCHAASPTGPNGSTVPNRTGSHPQHLALAGVVCATCHNNGGTGTAVHATAIFKNATTAYLTLDSTYNAEQGTYSYSSGKCSAVSCHGGKKTPAWTGGTIVVATDCLSCHEQGDASQSPEYNSFYSGTFGGSNEHASHLQKVYPGGNGRLIFCTDCHDTNNLPDAQHFGGLATHNFEWAAGNTIGVGTTRISAYTYTASTGTCTNSCHSFGGASGAPATAVWQK